MPQTESILGTIQHLFRFNTRRSRNAFGSVASCMGKTANCTQICPDYYPGCDEKQQIRQHSHNGTSKLSVPLI